MEPNNVLPLVMRIIMWIWYFITKFFILIQQGTVNSSQEQAINQGADYEAAVKIVEQIRKYDALLDNEFGENASELRSKVDELAELVEKKNNPSKVKIILTEIKNLALGVSGSLIASGLLTLL